jgi:hypothetical protein
VSLPYPDDNGLRAELDLINVPRSQSLAPYVNKSFLDEIKKSGLVERLYK